MLNIIRTEWLKIKNYPAFWWVMAITALTYPGINYMFTRIYNELLKAKSGSGQIMVFFLGNPFALPEGWRTVAYFSSLFVFIPAIVVIMLITNEYNYKTNRQNIIEGWSRSDFMVGKFFDVVILSTIVTVLYALVAFIIGINFTYDPAANKFSLVYYVALFGLQTFSQLSLAFLTGFLIRRSFIALAVFTFYFIILEPIATGILEHKYNVAWGEFFPLEISHKLLPRPGFWGKINPETYQRALEAVKPHIAYTLILVLLTWALCFWVNKRRDL